MTLAQDIANTLLAEFISSIPAYVWIGLLLILVGVILLLIPFVPRKFGTLSFLLGILIIGGITLFQELWNSSQTFRLITISLVTLIIVISLLNTKDDGKIKRR